MITQLINQHVNQNKKLFALLVDPDHHTDDSLLSIVKLAVKSEVDLILVGGSILLSSIDHSIDLIKKNTSIPVILFPGNLLQINNKADGIMLLSLISGRNPDLLIGNHVIAASALKNSSLEILPTGYILIDGGKASSVEYMSNTRPIPSDKTDIAISTAIAGEMIGLKYIYLEAGSGALKKPNSRLIEGVKKNISIPIIVGGGLNNPDDIKEAINAGADIIVVGTAVEENPSILPDLVHACKI
ncbi:MAG: geranylgeranylglyceryl/heptaprenylglyceryl phosphate synthase [Bacteroidales bacterium]|nr:geranylgeranylglyceryl/heptaprenylglyceryl phosphate synthase [Bacteroidales bacterium]